MTRYDALVRRLAELDAAGLKRRPRTVRPTSPSTAEVDGREVLLFCTNDYLGLADHPEIRTAWAGGGAGASRLISGTRPVHLAVEEAIAELYGRPALLFGSGYQANLALYSTVCVEGDLIASDALNHASIIDGIRLSPARRLIQPHLDPRLPDDTTLIALETLYSMDGDSPNLTAYPRGPWLALDEAHAFGCLGPGGLGVAAAQGVQPDFLVGTFGKAIGVAGAFVVGPPELRELLVSTGRSFVYTTAIPEPVAFAILAALALATDERRERLAANTARLRRGLRDRDIRALGHAHIVPIPTGARTMRIAGALLERGILAPGIRYPTVPRGHERVRLTVSAAHSDDQIDRCVDAVDRVLRTVDAE